ncbi:MAG: L-fucokinase [Phycisphaerales bacterium]
MAQQPVELIVTAARRAQARVYEALLRERARDGRLAANVRWRVLSDPDGRRVGSGVATALAIESVAGGASHIESHLRGRRVLVVHSGGDSRRLPAFAAVGKAFAPLPGLGGSPPGTIFDAVVADLLALPASPSGDVIVASGDTVVDASRWRDALGPDGLEGAGVVGIGQPGTPARGARHGVYVERRGRVVGFLQKPSAPEARRAGAIIRGGKVLIDTGIVRFSPAAAARFVRASRSLVGAAIAGRTGAIDLYRHVLQALVPGTSPAAYLDALDVGHPAERRGLRALIRGLAGTPFEVRVIGGRGFTHAGSTREYLALAHRAGTTSIGSERCVITASRAARRVVVGSLNARVDARGDNLVVGVPPGAPSFRLERFVGGVVLPIGSTGLATILFHAGDDAKTPLDRGGTIFGTSLRRWCDAAGVAPDSIVGPGGTMWEARLWVVGPRVAPPLWMTRGERAPNSWRTAKRRSLGELLESVNPERLLDLDRAIARVACVTRPAELLDDDGESAANLAVRAGDRAGCRAAAVELARAKAAPLRAARLLACASRLVRGDDAALGRRLLARAFERIGEAVASDVEMPRTPPVAAIRFDEAAWATAPARIDLAGGWSDTPPICHERGGTVVNVAIALDGRPPVHAIAKRSEKPEITLHSVDLGRTRVIRTSAELCRHDDPRDWTALAKAALRLTGIAPPSASQPLERWLRRFGGGLSLALFAAVPKGSGLGTSSILGATTLACLDRVVGRATDTRDLVARTSVLEQMIATRGGWQDQLGGLVGGFKLLRTEAGADQNPKVTALAPPERFTRELSERSVLCFTGLQRMARDILQRVVERYLVRDGEALETIARLKSGAERMADAIRVGDLGGFCAALSEYWSLKTTLDPNATTEAIESMVRPFRRQLDAWSMPGAGGGGFVLLVARDARAASRIRGELERRPPHARSRVVPYEVAPHGIDVSVL